MITIYDPNCDDFTNNGLGLLSPSRCVVKENAGGLYELELEHPMDEGKKWTLLSEQRIIKAPVPNQETPLLSVLADFTFNERQIYEVTLPPGYATADVRLLTPSMPIIEWLVPGEEVVYHGKQGLNDAVPRSVITTPKGNTGKIADASIKFKRTEMVDVTRKEKSGVVPARQIKEQLFRVYEVKEDVIGHVVRARARHVSYDYLGEVVKEFKIENKPADRALKTVKGQFANKTDIQFFTNVTQNVTLDWTGKNVIEILLDPDQGLVPAVKGQLVRDNWSLFILKNEPKDRGVMIEYGKNLTGYTGQVNDENVITRIVPVGTDEKNNKIYLPEGYVNSSHINEYPYVRAILLTVNEARVVKDKMTLAQAHDQMRKSAKEKFTQGCDLADIEIEVDFIMLGDTKEYQQLKDLQQIFLYDSVRVRHVKQGIDYSPQLTGYEFDALTGVYNKAVMGNIADGARLGMIAGFQIPNSGVGGNKITPGAVGSGHLQHLSVLSAHIGAAQIGSAHIQDAAIANAHIEDLAVTNAKIALLAVKEANIDDLAVTGAKIAKAAIDSAHIKDGAIDRVKIGKAAIGSAEIGQLAVGTGHIALGAITTALIKDGAIGKAQIADGSITDAKIVELTANKITAGTLSVERLVIVGNDKSIVFAINEANGTAQLSQTTIDGGSLTERSITADRIVAGSITAKELAAASILANHITAGAIESGHIKSDAIEGRHIKAGEVETNHLSAEVGETLNIASNKSIVAMVEGIEGIESRIELLPDQIKLEVEKLEIGGENLIPNSEEMITAPTESGFFVLAENLQPGETYVFSVEKAEGEGWLEPCEVAIANLQEVESYLPWEEGLVAKEETQGWVFTVPQGAIEPLSLVMDVADGIQKVLTKAKLAKGNKYSGWSAHPDDPVKELKNASIAITHDAITQTAGTFDVIADLFRLTHMLNNKMVMQMQDGDVSITTLAVTDGFYAPDAVGAYLSDVIPWQGSINASLANVPKYLKHETALRVPAGIYNENIEISGFVGSALHIILDPGVTINGILMIRSCASRLFISGNENSYAQINGTSSHAIVSVNYSNVFIKYLRMTGKVRTSNSTGTQY
ncbi:MAG: hypothetical protein GX786_03050, partial [Clostridiales bacterium]|nr:hypothetical protein [Clostridiales bacterium]